MGNDQQCCDAARFVVAVAVVDGGDADDSDDVGADDEADGGGD